MADDTARLAQTKVQLRHEIKRRQHAEELLLKEQQHLRHLLELQDRDRQMVSYEIHDRLTQRDDYIRVDVQDWGIGFNPREVGDGHFGLEGIQERARLFGGSATVKSALGKGTRIVVQLPLRSDLDTVIEQNDNPVTVLNAGNDVDKTFGADAIGTADE
ncbi:MAG: sensor histidine kinase [Pirellulaceae bacterium]